MRRYKMVSNGYILGICYNSKYGTLITNKEYQNINTALKNAPVVEENQIAYLRDSDLTWEIINTK